MKIHQFLFKKIITNITFPYMYEIFISRKINLMFLYYYQNTNYIRNYGICLNIFVMCLLHITLLQFQIFIKKTASIAFYDILFKKSRICVGQYFLDTQANCDPGIVLRILLTSMYCYSTYCFFWVVILS
jgi:hypothetical protein